MANQTAAALAPVKAIQNLMTTDPFRRFQEKYTRLFDEPFGLLAAFGEEPWSLTTWTPACDIYETDGEIVVKAELPETKKEDVHVTLENNLLIIRGERKLEEKTEREDYHRVERRYGEFLRSFTLPTFVDPNKINAEFKDGMLRITLQKREEAKPKQVEIKLK